MKDELHNPPKDFHSLPPSSSLASSSGPEKSQASVQNSLPLPPPLPESVKVNQKLLNQFVNQTNFTIYKVVEPFRSTDGDKRTLKIARDESVIGFTEMGGWVFGFKENDSRAFGFVPHNYLKEVRRISDQNNS